MTLNIGNRMKAMKFKKKLHFFFGWLVGGGLCLYRSMICRTAVCSVETVTNDGQSTDAGPHASLTVKNSV